MTAAPAALTRATRDGETDAAEVILFLAFVLRGNWDGEKGDRGLMPHMVGGEQHIERCQRGMWITQGLRGDPCSARCLRAQEALQVAAEWLYENRPARAEQLALFGESLEVVG